jgi:hypothetical protein
VRARHIVAWIVLAWVMTPFAGADAAGDESSAGQSGQTSALRFQRIIVPADRPEDWPREKDIRYVPMPAGEFERRIVQLAGGAAQSASRSQLIRAEYAARLQENALVAGEATWEFTHEGNEPETVDLGQCGLPLADFQWIARPAGSPTASNQQGRLTTRNNPRAIVGNDGSGRLAARVDRAGTMRGRWSLAGARDSGTVLTFVLRLPPCPITRLRLTLPANMELAADGGQVRAPGEATQDERTWVVELGGNHDVNLRLSAHVADGPGLQSTVRELHQFAISERGLELSSEFLFDASGPAPHQLSVLVDSPLTVVAARWNDIDLAVENVRGAQKTTANETPRIMVLDLPPQIKGEGSLTVQAIAPWELEKQSRLPLLHISDVRFEEGRARLVIAHPLELDQLLTHGCRQIAPDAPADSDSGAVEIQFFNDRPVIEVAVSRRREQIHVAQGTSVSLRANEGVARCVAALSSEDGERFVVEAEVAPQWIIDRVESVPDGLVADWSQQFGQGRPGKLTVRLSEPISPQQDVELLISARRRRAPMGDNLHADDLAMLRFLGTSAARRIVDVQATEPYQLQVHGADELNRLDPAQLSDEDVGLLMDYAGGLSFVADESARELSVSLATKQAVFDADIHGDFLAADDSFTELYHFAITPHGRDLGHFTVRFSQPRSEAIAWSIEGEPATVLSARRIGAAETTGAGGEVWEILLPLARQSPFVVIANRTTALHDSMPLALASVIDADSQHGAVEIRSLGRNLPEIISKRPAIPVEVPASGQFPAALAAFRYSPEEDALLSAEPPLVLALHADAAKPAWIWQADLTSRYLEGRSQHVLTCRVENAGRQRVQFQLPLGAQWRGAWVDDQPLIGSGERDRWRINLPSGARFTTIVLRWSDELGAGGLTAGRAAAWPECDIPILGRSWTVELPPGKGLASADISGTEAVIVPWTKRLLGPVGGAAKILDADAPGIRKRSAAPPPNPVSASDSSTTGWSHYRFDALGPSGASVWIADKVKLTAWAWTLFLLSAAAGWTIGRRGAAIQIATFGFGASLAMLVPVQWVPLSASIWLGLVAGRLALLLAARFQNRLVPRASNVDFMSARLAPAATISAGLVLLLFARGVLCAEETPVERSGQSDRYGVLVPVDAQGHPAGDFYYLPEKFYAQLEQSTPADQPQASYVIVQARYHTIPAAKVIGGVARENSDALVEASTRNWQADLEIESFSDHTIARLPIGLIGAALLPDGVQLDGQQAPIRTDNTHRFLCLDLDHAGTHRIAITFRPIAGRDQYDFDVPIVSAAQIDLSGLASPPAKVASALGAAQQKDDPASPIWLGPSNRIVLDQHHNGNVAASPPETPNFDVEGLYLLRIRPGTVSMDARFHVNVHSGRLDRLRLTIDPRWKLLAAPAGAQPHVDPNEPRTVEFDLSPTISGRSTIDARFALDGASGIGSWRPPAVEIQGAKSLRQSWGASIDASLLYEQRLPTSETKISAADFAARWPLADAKPQLAWESASAPTDAVILARPQAPKTTARYAMALIASDKDVAVRLGIDLATSEPTYQCRFAVPAQFDIESVALREQDGQRSCRWSRADNKLTVFLPSPDATTHQLLVVGRLPVPGDGNVTLPPVRVDQSTGDGFVALLYRRPEASLEISNRAGLTSPSSSDTTALVPRTRRETGLPTSGAIDDRLVALLIDPRESRPAILHIERNQPQMSLSQVIRLDRNADAWTATFDIDLTIEKGFVDALRLDLPSNWTGPLDVSPAMVHTVVEIPGENRRQLVLRPQESLAGNVQLRISGPLSIPAGQRPAAPNLQIAQADRQTLFYLLPRRSDNEQLEWDLRRLVPTQALPPGLAANIPKLENYLIYRLAGQRQSAALRSVERTSQAPLVRLVDVIVSWANDDHASGTAAFDLEPAGQTDCILQLPRGLRIVHARLDSAPAQLKPLSASRWSVWLGDNRLPRHLAVVFEGTLEGRSGSQRQLVTPMLVDFPVEQTLWTVIGPRRAGDAVFPDSAAVSSVAHARTRLEALAALGNSAASLLATEPPDVVANWCLPWIQRFLGCRARFVNLSSQSPVTSDPARADSANRAELEISALDQEFAKVNRRLAIDELAASAAADVAAGAGALSPSLAGDSVSFAVERGKALSILAAYPLETGLTSAIRSAIAITIALATGLLAWLARSG